MVFETFAFSLQLQRPSYMILAFKSTLLVAGIFRQFLEYFLAGLEHFFVYIKLFGPIFSTCALCDCTMKNLFVKKVGTRNISRITRRGLVKNVKHTCTKL